MLSFGFAIVVCWLLIVVVCGVFVCLVVVVCRLVVARSALFIFVGCLRCSGYFLMSLFVCWSFACCSLLLSFAAVIVSACLMLFVVVVDWRW